MFFQASPNHLTNHKICWGHCKSKDLLHWEYCPVALKPDQEYDKDGCFTGSAIVQGERLYLIYTCLLYTSYYNALDPNFDLKKKIKNMNVFNAAKIEYARLAIKAASVADARKTVEGLSLIHI